MAINRNTLSLQRLLLVDIGTEADDVTRALTQAWTRSWDVLHRTWTSALEDVADGATRTGVWPRPWEQARMLRLQQALGDSQAALAYLGQRAGVSITDGANNVIRATADYEPRLIASQLPAAGQATAATRFSGRITPSALDAIVARTQSDIVSTLQPLSARSMDAMRRELIKGVAVGDNPNVVAKAMLDRVQGAFEGGLTRAVNIARTEMLDAHRVAAMHTHAANADVLEGWVWWSALDKRTCPACWSMHGRVFPVTQPGPWDHQQGRCTRMPKTKTWKSLGIDAPEPPDVTVDPQARFNALPRATQLRIMGPERLRLLDNKTIDWGQLSQLRKNSGWRDSFTARPVRDLRGLAGLSPRAPRPSRFARIPARPVTPRAAPTKVARPPATKVARPAKVAPTKVTQPPAGPKGIRQAGRDITTKLRQEFGRIWDKVSSNWGYGDPMLTEVSRLQRGWNRAAQVVSKSKLDAAVGKGWTQVWRGVRSGTWADEMRTGDWKMGSGIYGSGVYTSSRRTTAEIYRGNYFRSGVFDPTDPFGHKNWDLNNGEWIGKWDMTSGTQRGLMRIAIDPDARFIDHHTLRGEYGDWIARLSPDVDTRFYTQMAGRNGMQLYAIMRGYDGVIVRARPGINDGAPYPDGWANVREADQYIIFNRSILMIEEASDRFDT